MTTDCKICGAKIDSVAAVLCGSCWALEIATRLPGFFEDPAARKLALDLLGLGTVEEQRLDQFRAAALQGLMAGLEADLSWVRVDNVSDVVRVAESFAKAMLHEANR